MYNFISAAIGPARGIQESLGTYDTYMKERSRTYYDCLMASRVHHLTSPSNRSHSAAHPNSLPDSSTGSCAVVENRDALQLDELINVPGVSDTHSARDSTGFISQPGHLSQDSRMLPSLPVYMQALFMSTRSSAKRTVVLPPISLDAVLASRHSVKPRAVHRHDDMRMRRARPRTSSAGGGI
ncbi:hypothetical protein NEOLEDRAFT_1130518 [Neolentinus lepideus HHB14362 ss-1]|uniref:Uncharacterized protein n=1 Tax=Neolentinus lepideus HHB14362 ss-1 TaxID=1314782 RepID=A0A165U2E9_9AGAM|nr:hypothetical protein NEOLEDRAFT_1130518 [Neolentinus lepideus HHB14362 ss-1]